MQLSVDYHFHLTLTLLPPLQTRLELQPKIWTPICFWVELWIVLQPVSLGQKLVGKELSFRLSSEALDLLSECMQQEAKKKRVGDVEENGEKSKEVSKVLRMARSSKERRPFRFIALEEHRRWIQISIDNALFLFSLLYHLVILLHPRLFGLQNNKSSSLEHPHDVNDLDPKSFSSSHSSRFFLVVLYIQVF